MERITGTILCPAYMYGYDAIRLKKKLEEFRSMASTATTMNTMKFKALTSTSTHKIKSKTHDTLYVWHGITDTSEVIFMKTTEQKQALKIVEGQFYVLKKFGHSADGPRMSVTLEPNTYVFRTNAFAYDEGVEAEFHDPTVTPINHILQGPVGIRLSVEGLVVDKSRFNGPDWARTDVTLCSEDERHRVVLKFWNENISRVMDIEEGQQLLATAMLTKKWKHHPMHLNPTDETMLTARAMDTREMLLTILDFDSDRCDNMVGVLCDNDNVYTMSTSLYHELQHMPHPLDVDAHVKGTHITQCSVVEDADFEATEGEIEVGGHQHNLETDGASGGTQPETDGASGGQ